MHAIDMHNHFIAPEVIAFLAREGAHFATRIVERDGRRFFPHPGIRAAADRWADLQCRRAHRRHGSRGRHDAGGLVRSVPDVSRSRGRQGARHRAGQQRRAGRAR